MAWRDVLDSRSLSEGQATEIVHQGNVIAIFRHEGRLYAIEDRKSVV